LPPGCASRQRHGQVKTITNIPIQPNIVQLEFSLEQIEKSGKCRECSNAVATQRNGFATQRNAVCNASSRSRDREDTGVKACPPSPGADVAQSFCLQCCVLRAVCRVLHVAWCLLHGACCMFPLSFLLPVAYCSYVAYFSYSYSYSYFHSYSHSYSYH
jgi:hypothetical protein